MPTSQHYLVRTDILELKCRIEKKIGRVQTENYLIILSKFLSLKISKSDFDKLIIATIKKENLTLHNDLLRGILKNVSGVERKKKQVNSFKSLCEDLPKSPPRKRRTQRRFRDCSKGKSQVTIEEDGGDGEEVDDQLIRRWRSQRIEAPFGVRDDVVKRKRHRIGTCCCSSGELLDSVSLKKKLEDDLGLMEERFEVSDGFVNSLNAGLDVFLKRLIKPCLELSALRSSSNGSSSASSLVDFQVAMELNRSILGEDWSEKLEKIRFC